MKKNAELLKAAAEAYRAYEAAGHALDQALAALAEPRDRVRLAMLRKHMGDPAKLHSALVTVARSEGIDAVVFNGDTPDV